MALIVEDGTGNPDAESYVSVAYFDNWCSKRPEYAALVASDDADKVGKLIEATGYADTVKRYKATRKSADQGLYFPREGLVDWDGMPVEGIPRRLKDAVCFLAATAFSEPLYENLGQTVKSESIGPISTTYADGSTAHKTFTAAERLLAPYWRDDRDNMPSPGWSGVEAEPTFTLGMQDSGPGLPDGGY